MSEETPPRLLELLCLNSQYGWLPDDLRKEVVRLASEENVDGPNCRLCGKPGVGDVSLCVGHVGYCLATAK